MSRLHIIYDPRDAVVVPSDTHDRPGLRVACLSAPADLEGRDIYEVARKLAELLLEQLP